MALPAVQFSQPQGAPLKAVMPRGQKPAQTVLRFGCADHFSKNPGNPLVDAYRPEDEKRSWLVRKCLKAIAWYQKTTRRPTQTGHNRLGIVCPYYPSCSSYTAEAIRQHGAIGGILKGVYRLLRCNPITVWFKTGKIRPGAGAIHDPVSGQPSSANFTWNQPKTAANPA